MWRHAVIALFIGWSRIGRSRSAEIRLDDPTVSRRHAVIVQTPEGELRVLDDRSMNGIRVNDEQVDWSPLADGDELEIGRYALSVIESARQTLVHQDRLVRAVCGADRTQGVVERRIDRD